MGCTYHFSALMISRCTYLDDLILPLCSHLAPNLSDEMILEVLSTVAKRLEVSLKKVRAKEMEAMATVELQLMLCLLFWNSAALRPWVL